MTTRLHLPSLSTIPEPRLVPSPSLASTSAPGMPQPQRVAPRDMLCNTISDWKPEPSLKSRQVADGRMIQAEKQRNVIMVGLAGPHCNWALITACRDNQTHSNRGGLHTLFELLNTKHLMSFRTVSWDPNCRITLTKATSIGSENYHQSCGLSFHIILYIYFSGYLKL